MKRYVPKVLTILFLMFVFMGESYAGINAKHENALTINPILSVGGVLHGSFEKKIDNKSSFTCTIGGGRFFLMEEAVETFGNIFSRIFSDDEYETIENTRIYLANIRGGYRYFLLGKFNHNLNLTVELASMFISVSYDTYENYSDGSSKKIKNDKTSGFGVALAPMIGYKFSSDSGFTVDLALGGGISVGISDEDTKLSFAPSGIINFGYSF